MPLPDTPLTIEGGCNCKAIRYRIAIPDISKRPLYPAGGDKVSPKVHMPLSCTDHCNDCRSATGSIVPSWLLTPIDMVSVSCVPLSTLPASGKLSADSSLLRSAQYLPAKSVFSANEADPAGPLAFFASSEGRRRSFCRRCGTMLSYQVFPLPEKWPRNWPVMLDIVLGTVDREYLEKGQLTPERQLWSECAVDWIQQLTTKGLLLAPVHPRFKVNELMIKK